MSSSLNQTRAIITGASSGIGKATALAFAQAGIHVALVSRSREKLTLVQTEVEKLGVNVKAYPIDLAQVDLVKDSLASVAEDFGPIDILVNNAGIGYTNYLSETPLSDWQKVLQLNLTSVFQCIQGVLPQMRNQGIGLIINVASISGKSFFPEWGAYSVSKAGLIALSKTLAAEERANGIRVVIVSPGAVNTPIWETETVQANFNRSVMLTPEMVAQSILYTAMFPSSGVIEEMTIMPSAGTL